MKSQRSNILRELQTPDEAMLAFNSFGLGGRLKPEDAAEFQAVTIARAVLADNVPKTCATTSSEHASCTSTAYWSTSSSRPPATTRCSCSRVPFGSRFLAFYSDGIPLMRGETEELLLATTFEDVLEACRARLRGADGTTHWLPLSADALLSWARREQLLAGTRAKIIEGLLSERRIHAAHPVGHTINMPVDSLARSAMWPRRSTSYGAMALQADASFPPRWPASRGSPRWRQTATAAAKCAEQVPEADECERGYNYGVSWRSRTIG